MIDMQDDGLMVMTQDDWSRLELEAPAVYWAIHVHNRLVTVEKKL